MQAVPTTCPFCACGCGFYLLTNTETLVGVAPSENHPISRGKLCARGWCAHEAPLWGSRLSQPLVRWTGSPEPASWPSAVDYVTTRIRRLMDAGKAVGVLGSARATNEENYLAGKLARVGLSTNNIDFSYHSICRPVLEGIEDVAGECAPSAALHDIDTSEAILLIEGDLAESHPQAASCVMRALERGARLITLGCRRTQMVRLSSLHFETTPGNEGELINGLLAAAVRLGRADRPPVAVEGYELLRRSLEAVEVTDDLRQAARWILNAENATFLVAPLSGFRDQCRKNAAALTTLAAVTGHLNKAGSGVLPLLARSNARGACDMGVAPDRLPGYEPLGCERAQKRMEKLWGKSLPADHGLDTEALLQSASGLIIVADDPPSILQMGRRARAALRNLDFLVVLDAFVTPTTEVAHVVLPIASFAETEGTCTSIEGRVQRIREAADPPGEARAGWQALAELCERFGASAHYSSAADVVREIAQAAPFYGGVEEQVLVEGWSENRAHRPDGAKPALHPALAAASQTPADHSYVLTHHSAFDWGRDPLVSFSPTLNRDFRAERKLFPNGFVEVSQRDGDSLGLHAGRGMKLSSAHGDAVVPVRLRTDLKPGVLLVPFAFRDQVANVLGPESVVFVSVEPA
jgi:predicted molibdopterin-dependent oxidoreductase YjgC